MNELSANYISANCFGGKPLPPDLESWLQRASVLAATYGSAAREGYCRWVHDQVRQRAVGPCNWRAVEIMPSSTVAYTASQPPPPIPSPPVAGGGFTFSRPGLDSQAEHSRLVALKRACAARLEHIYARSGASTVRSMHQIMETELDRVCRAVNEGSVPSLYRVGSEAVVAAVMRPHPVPPPTGLSARLILLPAATVPGPPMQASVAPPPVATQRAVPSGAHHHSGPSSLPSPVTAASIAARMGKFFPSSTVDAFVHGTVAGGSGTSPTSAGSPAFSNAGGVIGKSKELERRYTRETPKTSELRPRRVLPRAMAHLATKFARILAGNTDDLGTSSKVVFGQNPPWEGSRWLSEQLKGMRQDIKAQGLSDAFAVAVYEAHARLCLRIGDPLEFSGCQAALMSYYAAGITSDATDPEAASVAHAMCSANAVRSSQLGIEAVVEFTAYRMLYLTLNGLSSAVGLEEQRESGRLEGTMGENVETVADVDAEKKRTAAKKLGPGALVGVGPIGTYFVLCRNGNVDYTRRARGKTPTMAEQEAAPSSADGLDSIVLRPEIRRVQHLCSAIETRDGPAATAALAALVGDEACAAIVPGIAGLIAPALQRLRVQWLFSVLHKGAKGSLSPPFLAAWLGFPWVDSLCAGHVLGHVNTGAGFPGAAEAWDGLWSTLNVPDGARPTFHQAQSESGAEKASKRHRREEEPAAGSFTGSSAHCFEGFADEADPSCVTVADETAAGIQTATLAEAVVAYTAFLRGGSSGAGIVGSNA